MKAKRKIIEIDEELCTGCGDCILKCAEGSLRIIDGKAHLIADNLCDGFGACLGTCPTGALTIIEREAEEFDEEAVEKFIAEQRKAAEKGCPSAQARTMTPASDHAANRPNSALSHWPVQIRLIPPGTPFLEDCDLLIAADCTAVAYGSLQQDFIQGRTVMIGCPKFDDQQLYVDRFTEMFQLDRLNSVTILIMEVPCCSALLQLVRAAYDRAEATVSVRHIVVSTQGKLLDNQLWQQAV